MTSAQLNTARDHLLDCVTLDQADTALQGLRPKLTTAQRWGLWDGWSGRPATDAGLPRAADAEKQTREYMAAVEIGRRLFLDDEPA